MTLVGTELLYVNPVAENGMPSATVVPTTTAAIAALADAANVPAVVNTAISTVGNGTLTAAGLVGGIITRSGPVAAFTDTTATAVQIVAALTAYVADQSYFVRIRNTTAYVGTLAAGAGVTLSGTGTLPPYSEGLYLMTTTSATAVTILTVQISSLDLTTQLYAQGTINLDGTVVANVSAADKDFTIKKLTSGSALVYDAGADTLTLSGALTQDGGAVFNEASADVDFRVESNGNANALFVDAGNDRVGILNASPSTALDVTGTVTATGFGLLAQGTFKVATVLLTATELGGSETDTSFSFPANGAILLNAWLDVTDAEAGTVDVGTQGTSNDPNGIMEAADLSELGYRPTVAGALLGKFITGSDPVSVTASADLNSCTATLFIYYIELPAP